MNDGRTHYEGISELLDSPPDNLIANVTDPNVRPTLVSF